MLLKNMLVKEYISFERGKDPKDILGIGYHKVMDLKEYDIIVFINNIERMRLGLGDVGVIKNIKYTKNTITIIFYPFSSIKSAKNARSFMIKNNSSYHTSTITRSIEEWMELIDVERYEDTNESLLEFERGIDPKKVLGIGPKDSETFVASVIYYGKTDNSDLIRKNKKIKKSEYTTEEIQSMITENRDIDILINKKMDHLYFSGWKKDEPAGYALYTPLFLRTKKGCKWLEFENEYYTL